MPTAKQDSLAALAAMPDDARMEDIPYRLYVHEQVWEGLEDLDAGRVRTRDDVKARLARWLAD